MDEHINKEAFLKAKREQYCADCDRRKNSKGKMVYDIGDAPCRACGVDDMLDDVENFPAEDVRPVVRAHWTDKRTIEHDGEWYCSECGNEPYYARDVHTLNFCPNCGARMGNLSEEEHDNEQREYEATIEAAQYCEMYEPTYDPETGAM